MLNQSSTTPIHLGRDAAHDRIVPAHALQILHPLLDLLDLLVTRQEKLAFVLPALNTPNVFSEHAHCMSIADLGHATAHS